MATLSDRASSGKSVEGEAHRHEGRLDLLMQPVKPLVQETQEDADELCRRETEFQSDTPETSTEAFKDQEKQWREALVGVCAKVLEKTEDQLQLDFEKEVQDGFGEVVGFIGGEGTPRDLTDYAVMSMLKSQDVLSMQNASSWLFNLMDRSGHGLVFRDEFVRYAPFMVPLADAAIADILFETLVECQSRMEKEREHDPQNLSCSERNDRKAFVKVMEHVRKQKRPAQRKLRRAMKTLMHSGGTSKNTDIEKADALAEGSSTPIKEQSSYRTSVEKEAAQELSHLSAISLKFEAWNAYVKSVQESFNGNESEWNRAKRYLGIDITEPLITSQNAVDHSDLWPTLGKLFLSERYLVFFAFIGKNHYIARLGAATVYPRSLPLLFRECIGVRLDNETTTALYGLSISQNTPAEVSKGGKPRSGEISDSEDASRSGDVVEEHLYAQEPTIPVHVDHLMKRYTSGNKDLCFSMMELGDTKLRDHWIELIEEVIAAHKLHLKLGFGTSGRSLPPAHHEESHKESAVMRHSYRTSPFRHDVPPPLLAFTAHVNIVRYQGLLRICNSLECEKLLMFSHPEHHSRVINWYVESVKSYNGWRSSSWITRAVSAIKENIQINRHMYTLKDDEPFDVARLGEGIQRFAELIAPIASVMQKCAFIIQWENPTASILVFLICAYFIYMDWIKYLPGLFFLSQALLMIGIKRNLFGLGEGSFGGKDEEDVKKRQARVLSIVSQVQGALHGAQNFFIRVNEQLGKVQSLYLWGADAWMSWTALIASTLLGFVLLAATSRVLFTFFVILAFTKHFTPPRNPVINFWESVPSKTVGNKEKTAADPSKRRSRFRKRIKNKDE